VESVAFSPNGKLLASGSRDETIKLWDVKTGKELATLKGEWGTVLSVVFSPNGKLLASGHDRHVVKLWDVASRKESVPLRWRGDLANCKSVAFSPDGKALAAACDSKVRWWDVSTGNELPALEGHTTQFVSVAFSPDGKLLASGSIDRTIKLWKIADRKGKGK
jgi:WD40 repeat protein